MAKILFKIDARADVTVTSKEIHQQLKKIPKLSASQTTLHGPGHHPLKLLGPYTGTIQKDDKITEEVLVIQGAPQAVLGCPAIQALNLVLRVFQIKAVNVGVQCKIHYPNLFTGLSDLKGDFKITLQKPTQLQHRGEFQYRSYLRCPLS